MAKSIEWEKDKVIAVLQDHGELHARYNLPPGAKTDLVNQLGDVRGKCFKTCLLIAYHYSDKYYYCEGYANGKPHAWLKPKTIEEEINHYWCIDPTWPWRVKSNGFKPLDNINYVGIAVDGVKTVNALRKLKGSGSIFKMIDYLNIEDLK